MFNSQILENELLRIEVSEHGAELCRIIDKTHQRDVLYNADPNWWNRHAPILFPFVGAVRGGRYFYNGKEYAMSQHGFARDMEFHLEKADRVSCTYTLTDTEETRQKYPFSFTLRVQHILRGNVVEVRWEVISHSDPLLFKIGAHPAFVLPILPNTTLDQYFLSVDGRDTISYRLIAPGTGCVDDDRLYFISAENGRLPLSEELFSHDALIMDDYTIRKASLLMPDGSPYITVTCDAFSHLGVWKKPGAPFVCLEPWQGRADNMDSSLDLTAKEGILSLNSEKSYQTGFDIIVH